MPPSFFWCDHLRGQSFIQENLWLGLHFKCLADGSGPLFSPWWVNFIAHTIKYFNLNQWFRYLEEIWWYNIIILIICFTNKIIINAWRQSHCTKNEVFHWKLRIWSYLLNKSFMEKFFVQCQHSKHFSHFGYFVSQNTNNNCRSISITYIEFLLYLFGIFNEQCIENFLLLGLLLLFFYRHYWLSW